MSSKTTLAHPLDMEARIEQATPQDTIKGMFLARVEQMLSEADGVDRPRRLPFRDYPLAEYFRAVDAAAAALYPHVPRSEGVRRVGGDDFAAFARSGIGRVSLALLGDVYGTLARAGQLYGVVLGGRSQIESWVDGELIRLEYRHYPGPVEVYPIGTIESTCRYFGADWEIDIEVLSPRDADYAVRPIPR